jgi:hypothetical protein
MKILITVVVDLVKMWKWAKKQPNRERFVWENYEISKGIYEF